MKLLGPALLALASAVAAPEAMTEGEAKGNLWREASAPFRHRARPARPPGHLSVADGVQRRRSLRSPFSPPSGDAPLYTKGAPARTRVMSLAEGSLLLDEISHQIQALAESVDSSPPDRILKSADALRARLASATLTSKAQRAKVAALTETLTKLIGRLERRAAFAALNPRVRFIIWSPDVDAGKTKSLAVINQRVLHEGDVLVPGVTVSAISQHEVTFDLGGEQVAVGLK